MTDKAQGAAAEDLPPLPHALVSTRHGTPVYTVGQMMDYACAALKAQPAPTEAQGEPTAEQYSEMLRALCCQYGVGGYNSDGLINPDVAGEKLAAALDEQFRVGGEMALKKVRGEDSVRLDAARYQWLCEKYGVTWFPCFLEQKLEYGYIADGKESIDEAIDRARASAKTGGVKS